MTNSLRLAKNKKADKYVLQTFAFAFLIILAGFFLSLYSFLNNFKILFGGAVAKEEIKGSSIAIYDKVVAALASREEIIFARTQPDLSSLKVGSGVQWPLRGAITTYFSSYHQGIDIAAAYNTPIYPIREGRVARVEMNGGSLGRYVVVGHGGSLKSFYVHLNLVAVHPGERVGLSTKLGSVGTTGFTTGPHLHLTTSYKGVSFDPLAVLRR